MLFTRGAEVWLPLIQGNPSTRAVQRLTAGTRPEQTHGMRLLYWRVVGGQLKAWFVGPAAVALTLVGFAGVTVTGILSGLGRLPLWAPVPLTAAVLLVVAEEVGYRGWTQQQKERSEDEPRSSQPWSAHLGDLKNLAADVADAIRSRSVYPPGSLLMSFNVHFPDEGKLVHAYENSTHDDAIDAREAMGTMPERRGEDRDGRNWQRRPLWSG